MKLIVADWFWRAVWQVAWWLLLARLPAYSPEDWRERFVRRVVWRSHQAWYRRRFPEGYR